MAFAHTRLVGYVEQPSLLEKLDTWAAGSAEIVAQPKGPESGLQRIGSVHPSELAEGKTPALGHTVCLCGDSGVGKTALIAAAGIKLEESDPSAIVIMHFAGVDSESGHLKHIIWRIITELTEVLEIEEGRALLKKCDDLSAKKAAEEMLNEFPAILQIAVEAANKRTIRIMIDNADTLNWIPEVFGSFVTQKFHDFGFAPHFT